MYEFREDLINPIFYPIKCPYEMKPEFIVVHNTANDASAANEAAYMKNNGKKVSFHYAIDDKEVIYAVPENRNTWNAGDGENGRGNRFGISVEICYSKSGGKRFLLAQDNAAAFIAKKMHEYNFCISDIKRHKDFSGKNCPHRTMELGWDKFLEKIKEYYNKTSELENANDIVYELSTHIKIDDPMKAVSELSIYEEKNTSVYWILRKLANKLRVK